MVTHSGPQLEDPWQREGKDFTSYKYQWPCEASSTYSYMLDIKALVTVLA